MKRLDYINSGKLLKNVKWDEIIEEIEELSYKDLIVLRGCISEKIEELEEYIESRQHKLVNQNRRSYVSGANL